MSSFPGVVRPALFVWIIAGVGVTAFLWDRENRPRAFFVGSFLLFSFLAVCPGFFFRQHYFIQMLPAVALLAGIAVSSATQRLTSAGHGLLVTAIPVFLFLIACANSIDNQKLFFFKMNPLAACRSVYNENPFPEAVQVANYIDSHAPKRRAHCSARVGAGNLLLYKTALGDWLHLYLRSDGATEVRFRNAEADD